MSRPLLQVQNLSLSFQQQQGDVRGIDDVSFELQSNEVVGIIGESGSGKSLTAQSLLQLWPNSPHRRSGKIFYKGTDLLTLKQDAMQSIRGREIGMISQDPNSALNPTMKIGHQIIEGLIYHTRISKKEAWQLAQKGLEQVGIGDAAERMHQYPHELSGGMKQRIMIAMAMLCKPSLLIADEPTTALDVTIQAQVLELFKRLRQYSQTTLLLITHDLGVVARCCDRVLVMYKGQMIESATVDDLFAAPKHPYTQALLQSKRSLTDGHEELYIGENFYV
jgi:ABC-type dipeptide/oligopeptide/nickel transport system ATPase component